MPKNTSLSTSAINRNTNTDNQFSKTVHDRLNSAFFSDKKQNQIQSSHNLDISNSEMSDLLQVEESVKIYPEANSVDNIVFIKELNEMDEFFIKQTLINHFMFTNEEFIQIILDDLIEIKVQKGKILYEQNDEGEYFYIVKSGLFESTGPNSTTFDRFYKPWDCFGDLSLIQNSSVMKIFR